MREKTSEKTGTGKGQREKGSSFKNKGKNQAERSFCPAAGNCGSCQYAGIPYEKQLQMKQKLAEKLLSPYGKVQPIIGADEPDHYRNKVHAVLGRKKDGTVISGTYEEGSHRLVPVESCRLEDQKADAIIADMRKLLASFKIQIFNENSGYGLVRHILIRVGKKTGQILVVLIVTSPIFPSKNNFVKALLKQHPEITSVVLNVNDRRTSMVLGKRDIVLYGKGWIEDVLCGETFRISAQSFYQINRDQTEKLYSKAIELAGLAGREKVIDAYCGIGTIGLIAARKAGNVIGVELNPAAVRDAKENARRNRIENIAFYEADAGEFMADMAQDGEEADVLFMDPPRSGSTEVFMDSARKLGPKKIVYISCEPETQARDLKYLTRRGYRAQAIYPVDMFPHTEKIETVVLLSRE